MTCKNPVTIIPQGPPIRQMRAKTFMNRDILNTVFISYVCIKLSEKIESMVKIFLFNEFE